MMFSDSSGKQGLYEDAQFLCRVDSNAFPIADFTRLANVWYRRANVVVWKNQDAWRFDDTLNIGSGDADDDAGLPVATSSLTNSTSTYTLPTNAMRIRRVEIKDNAGIWFPQCFLLRGGGDRAKRRT